jgi:hypothetical protein
MPDRIAKDLGRGVASVAVLGQVGPLADYPAAKVTALQAMIAGVRAKQAVSNSTESAKTIKRAQNRKLYRDVWVDLIGWYAVATVTAPENARDSLKDIDTSLDFSEANCLLRAQQTLGALENFPDDYVAADLTKAQLATLINEALASDAEEQALISADSIADGELKTADEELHQELVDVLKILQAVIPKGDPRREAVDNIPRAAATTTTTPSTPGGTVTTTGAPSLPTDLGSRPGG